MTEWVEQQICIKFCIKLEHSSEKTIRMSQKAIAMGNWWLAASSQQHVCSCIASHAEFFGKTSNHPGDWAPLQPRFGALLLLAFPKTKITFEREKISESPWDSGKYNGSIDSDWENCVRSRGAYLEGDWGIIVLCTVFLVSSSINVSIFHIMWLDTVWTDLVCRECCLLNINDYCGRACLFYFLMLYFCQNYNIIECPWDWKNMSIQIFVLLSGIDNPNVWLCVMVKTIILLNSYNQTFTECLICSMHHSLYFIF